MDNAINGLKTIVGGLMLHLLLHPSDFTAESILLVGAGFAVIHGLMAGMQVIGKLNINLFSYSTHTSLFFIDGLKTAYSFRSFDDFLQPVLYPLSSEIQS